MTSFGNYTCHTPLPSIFSTTSACTSVITYPTSALSRFLLSSRNNDAGKASLCRRDAGGSVAARKPCLFRHRNSLRLTHLITSFPVLSIAIKSLIFSHPLTMYLWLHDSIVAGLASFADAGHLRFVSSHSASRHHFHNICQQQPHHSSHTLV